MWGNWPLSSSPPSGIWLRTRVPERFGKFAFFARRNGSHITPCARLCAGHLRIGVARLKPWQTAVFNRGKELFLYLYKNSASHYSFQGGYIWSDLTKIWGSTVRIWTKNSSEKPNVPRTCMQQLHYFLYGQNNWKNPGLRSRNDLWTTDLPSWGTPLWLAGPGYRTDWGVFPLSPLSLHLLHRCLPTKENKNNTTAVTGLSIRVCHELELWHSSKISVNPATTSQNQHVPEYWTITP